MFNLFNFDRQVFGKQGLCASDDAAANNSK